MHAVASLCIGLHRFSGANDGSDANDANPGTSWTGHDCFTHIPGHLDVGHATGRGPPGDAATQQAQTWGDVGQTALDIGTSRGLD